MSRRSRQTQTPVVAPSAPASETEQITAPTDVAETTEQTPAPVAEPVTQEMLDAALVKARATNLDRYAKVVRVVSLAKSGAPARVVITCSCGAEREIATQDLFQVTRCEPCQKKISRKARRSARKGRIAALKARVAELEAMVTEDPMGSLVEQR
jgi:hypothetical protein